MQWRLEDSSEEAFAEVKLEPQRVEDVPIPEVSSLALTRGHDGTSQLLAIGDRGSMIARAELVDEPLEWTLVNSRRRGLDPQYGQFEGIAAFGAGRVYLLSEAPAVVQVFELDGSHADTVLLEAGDRGKLRDVLSDVSSSGEGLLPLRDGRLLVAKEKHPPLLVEFGPPTTAARDIEPGSFPVVGDSLEPLQSRLLALAAWQIAGVEDVSDLAFAEGTLYALSDQSRRVVAVDLPVMVDARRVSVRQAWELKLPSRKREPSGKPEGLVVTEDGSFIVGLDTKTPWGNMCWYRP